MMKKNLLIKTLLGASILAIGAGSFAFANAKPATMTEATVGTLANGKQDPSVPGGLAYAIIRSTAWQTNATSYNYYFHFTNTTTHVDAYTKMAGWVATLLTGTGVDNYVLVAPSPIVSGTTVWNTVQLMRFPAACLDPATYAQSDFVITKSVTLSSTTANCLVIPSGTAVPADSITTAAANADSWSTNYPNRDYVHYWCAEFMARTGVICGGATKTASDYASAWTTCQASFAAIGNATITNFFKSATATQGDFSPSSTTIYRNYVAYRYDLIYNRYYAANSNITNFAARTITASTPAASVEPSVNDSSSTLVLGGLAGVAALAAGAYFFVRKKKSA